MSPQPWDWVLEAGSLLRWRRSPLPNRFQLTGASSAFGGGLGAQERLQGGHAGGRPFKQNVSPLVVSCSATIRPDGGRGVHVSGECVTFVLDTEHMCMTLSRRVSLGHRGPCTTFSVTLKSVAMCRSKAKEVPPL